MPSTPGRFPGRCALLQALLILILLIPVSEAIDLKNPPEPLEMDSLVKNGWLEASAQLSRALADAYVPGKNGRPGISDNVSFTAWLDLQQGCELLAKSCASETTALVQRHFFKERGSGKLFFVSPGQTPPANFDAIPDAEASPMAAHPQIRDQLRKAVLPRGAVPADGTLGDVAGAALAKDLLSDPSLLHALLSTISDKDYAPLVFKNLRALRESRPDSWREYGHLAIALAVVNDSALPEIWPHAQVTAPLVPKEIPSIEIQFDRWIRAHQSHQLELDPRQLSPSQLKFVVDAFVAESELVWARKNIRLVRANFHRAFSQVRYRKDRADAQKFFWTHAPYTLEEIRKQGGICVDQAYYAMIAGKARGLPTLFFTGQGKDGGHAWFGFMKRDDQWELDVGRYSNRNYAVGQALDPQTWQPISDHELKLLAARFRDRPEFAASRNDLAMAALFEKLGDSARAATALDSAIQTCPQNPDAWERRSEFLARTGAPLPERIRHHEQAVKRFASIPDLKVRHQNALAGLHRQDGDSTTASNLERTVLLQNRRHRTDLSVAAAAQKMESALASGNLDTAAAEFHRQLHALGKNGGGDFLRQVALPFIEALLRDGKKVRARRAIATMRQQMSPEPGTLLDLALRDLEKSTRP